MTAILVTVSGALASADQDYLLQARQMQALSLAVHIPLVCFGIAFPAMVLFCEWRFLRTGDLVFRALARRWSKVMLALFAVGVVTGTILSFELGLLWPEFMASFGNVFGLGFTLEGFSFFIEAIFVAIYVYGWDRLPPRLHFLSGIPVVIAGVTGALFVISVNGWMNHPGGFTLRDARAVNAHPWSALFGNFFFWHEFVHMYFAGYIVAGFLVAATYAWGFLRGRWGRYERTALTIALSAAAIAAPLQLVIGDWAAREVASAQPTKLAAIEGLGPTTRGAPGTPAGLVQRSRGRLWHRNSAPAVAAGLPQPQRHRPRPRRGAPTRPATDQRRTLRLSDDGRDRDDAGAAGRRVPLRSLAP